MDITYSTNNQCWYGITVNILNEGRFSTLDPLLNSKFALPVVYNAIHPCLGCIARSFAFAYVSSLSR